MARKQKRREGKERGMGRDKEEGATGGKNRHSAHLVWLSREWVFSTCICFVLFSVVGIEPRALHLLGKHPTTVTHLYFGFEDRVCLSCSDRP